MNEQDLKELAKRFAGDVMHIDEFAEIVTHHFDISTAEARRLIIENLAVGRAMVFL